MTGPPLDEASHSVLRGRFFRSLPARMPSFFNGAEQLASASDTFVMPSRSGASLCHTTMETAPPPLPLVSILPA
eukprot:scaffold127461_cov26-Prasinocladus_malaysianus.AAC.4